MTRGDIVVAVTPGAYGRPRPYVVVQADVMTAIIDSVVLCPLSSDVGPNPVRIAVTPTPLNGLNLLSEVMVDKIVAVPRGKIGSRIGRLAGEEVEALDQALVLVLGLGATASRPRG